MTRDRFLNMPRDSKREWISEQIQCPVCGGVCEDRAGCLNQVSDWDLLELVAFRFFMDGDYGEYND